MTAKATIVGSELKIETPYNGSFVAEIKAIPGKRWDPVARVWFVPIREAERVGVLIRKYFPVAGQNQVTYEILVLDVTAASSARRSYCSNVMVDGVDVINRASGNPVAKSGAFETLEVAGGFTKGDGRHAFEVQYRLTLRVRKGATIASYNSNQNSASYEIIERRPVE